MSQIIESSRSDIVQYIMSTKVETVKPDQSLSIALKKMVTRNIGSVIVTEGNTPVGIVTERDVSRCIAKSVRSLNTSVKRLMTRSLIVATPTMTNQEALGTMLRNGIRRIPIVDDGKLIGIITERDLLRWVLKVTYEPNIPADIKEILARPAASKT